jgi:hypothetical protein
VPLAGTASWRGNLAFATILVAENQQKISRFG